MNDQLACQLHAGRWLYSWRQVGPLLAVVRRALEAEQQSGGDQSDSSAANTALRLPAIQRLLSAGTPLARVRCAENHLWKLLSR